MEYDKINGKVAFQEGPHRYFNIDDESIVYTSVTTLIGKYEPEFDSDFTSKYKAIERLVPADVWKKEKGGLSTGALVGIIVGSVVGAGLIAVGIVFLVNHCRKRNKVKMKVNSQTIDLIQFS